jgi:hypothetical protein
MTLLLAPGLTRSLLLPLCHKYMELGAVTLAAIISNTFTKAQPVADHSKRWFFGRCNGILDAMTL